MSELKCKYMPIGIDPGQQGGLAAFDPTAYALVDIKKVPTRKLKLCAVTKSKKKSEPFILAHTNTVIYDTPEMEQYLQRCDDTAKYLGYKGCVCAIESPTIRTGFSSPASYFSTGGCIQAWHECLARNKIPFFTVSPISWKSDLKLTSSKELSCSTAQSIFPKTSKDL
jgi:hypothetical protein